MAKKKSHPKDQPETPTEPQSEPTCALEALPTNGLQDDQASACNDHRDVEPAAVPPAEMTRTVAMLAYANLGTPRPGRPIFVIAPTTQDVFQLTVCHENQLESYLVALPRLPSQDDTRDEDEASHHEFGELVWGMGPARKPRAAIVGRALHDLKAWAEPTAQTYLRVCLHIQSEGVHHLRKPITKALSKAFKQETKSKHTKRTVANLLKRAIDTLGQQGWVALRPIHAGGGAYLVGRGIEIFNEFPAWNRDDMEAPTLKRPGGSSPTRKLRELDAASEPPAEQT